MKTLRSPLSVRCELSEPEKQQLHSMLERDLRVQRQSRIFECVERDYQRKRIKLIAKAERQKAILDESLERTMAVIQWESQWELDNLETFCEKFLKESKSVEFFEEDFDLKESVVYHSEEPSHDEKALLSVFMVQYGLAVMSCLGLLWKGMIM